MHAAMTFRSAGAGENISDNEFVTGFDEAQVSEDTPHFHAGLCENGQTDGRCDLPDQWPRRVCAVGRRSPIPVAMCVAAKSLRPHKLP